MEKLYSFCYVAYCSRCLLVSRKEGRSEVGKPGLHGQARIALFLVPGDVRALVAFAEFAAVFVDEQAEVRECRWGPAKCLV